MTYKPAIIIAAYNRPRSLDRLLNSLLRMKNGSDVRLIISIDNKAPDNYNVRDIADDFRWPFGEKEVRFQEKHLGLRKHILQCGELSHEYGSVIILEDDLLVAPYFYDYTLKALEYYGEDPGIAGISLYNQPTNEMNLLPFSPIYDDSDVYFMQFPSSLGQAWTSDQWRGFRNWYDEDPDITSIIPRGMLGWPETSWKKYFSAYITVHDKYFVFPRQSLTTNFNDPGTHMTKEVNHDGQAQLRLSGSPYRFMRLQESLCKYDHLLELIPDCMKQYAPELNDYDFEMDLYGLKEMALIKPSYVITSKPTSDPVRSFKRALKPHEMNIILDIPGNDLFLSKKEDVLPVGNRYAKVISDHKYFYRRYFVDWKVRMYNYYSKFKAKMKLH